MIDLSTLEGKDTEGKVKQLCYKAMHLCDDIRGLPCVAAICVYPNHVKTAKIALIGSAVKVASVAVAFSKREFDTPCKVGRYKICD